MDQYDLDILYEDNHIIAVNKSVSDLVQSDITGDLSLKDKVAEYLKKKYNKKGNVFVGVPHRIDRPVSGVVIFARTSKALTRLNNMFKDKSVEKNYWAVVANKPFPTEGTLVHYLKRNQKQNKSYATDNEIPDSKYAKLNYRLIGSSVRYHFLVIGIETGRHHQIRCQLTTINCPVKGDLKYGYPRSNKNGGIHLHAREIKFIHPVSNEQILIVAPPPDDILWNEFLKFVEK